MDCILLYRNEYTPASLANYNRYRKKWLLQDDILNSKSTTYLKIKPRAQSVLNTFIYLHRQRQPCV